MNLLSHLARLYQNSTHGRRESSRDFTIDYEAFLRHAGMADGDARELAEREMISLEKMANGIFCIDRHKRSGLPQRLRLAREGGEAWLFGHLGRITPSQERSELSAQFSLVAEKTVPGTWQAGWTKWFRELATAAREGESVQPFRRDDLDDNHVLVHTLSGILHWSSTALIRYASTAICGDSKQLQRLEARLRPALYAITGSDSLETFGILRKPRWVSFHGPLIMQIGESITDFGMFPAPVMLADTNFTAQTTFLTSASICLTVENEDTFHELAATNPGVILINTSYAGAGVIKMISLLPQHLQFFHFGDLDAAGSDILRDLRAKTNRPIEQLVIPNHMSQARHALRDFDRKTLQRLLATDLPASERSQVIDLIENGVPQNYEQESIAPAEVWKALGM